MRDHPDKTAGARRPAKPGPNAVGMLAAMTVALATSGCDSSTARTDQIPAQAEPTPRAVVESAPVAEPAGPRLVEDDGQTLWASPTDGPPLTLAGLPPGIDLVLALRPAALMAHPEGEKVLAALGPLGADAVRIAESTIGKPLREIDRLLVGWQNGADGRWQTTILETRPGDAVPPLTRDMQRLVARTDADRHATLLFRPAALLDENRSPLAGSMAQLRKVFDEFLGDGFSTAAVSLHWDDNFFVELIGIPTLDVPTHRKADELARKLDETPDHVEEFVIGLSPSPYGRRVVARFPGMVRKLAAYTRHEDDGDAVTFRSYLPAVAGHNLLMGAELTLSEARAARHGMIE